MGGVVAPNGGSVQIHCENCLQLYYTCDGSEWAIPGTIERRRGVCDKCYEGRGYSLTWSGNVVKLNCKVKGCNKTYGVITWSDWGQIGTTRKYTGYCVSCYYKK
mmetsp:Transcript_48334/g.59460  ORF Transcript_48334/g.59460 Transcript_48334/m.59460 type:complete len:104 (+) Transcript_48334:74-385(+)